MCKLANLGFLVFLAECTEAYERHLDRDEYYSKQVK